LKLSRLMDQAYGQKARNRRLETKRGDPILGLEDLAGELSEKPTKADVARLVSGDEALMRMLISQRPKGRRNITVWGYITSLAAEAASGPLELATGDYAGLELSSGCIIVHHGGDHLGERMTGGRVEVQGKAGAYLGQEMAGGGIVAHSCGDYAFRNMKSGWGVVRGNAGNYAGLGNWGGRILVRGSSGERTGWMMRGGRIGILGDAGDYLGILMKGGEIFVRGSAGRRAGIMMKGGLISASDFGPECGAEALGGNIIRRDR
jgi:formylmethanofuran dehydrogenase subunit C